MKRSDLIDVSDTDPWERSTEADPLDPPVILATGVRATLNIAPFFRSASSGEPGDTETLQALMTCDPTDLKYHDLVVDETTGQSGMSSGRFNSPASRALTTFRLS